MWWNITHGVDNVSKTFFTNCCAWHFFFTGEAVYFHSIHCLLDSSFHWPNYVYPICKHFHTFFYKFHMVCTFQPPKTWWQTSVQVWSTLFYFIPLWIALKQLFLWDSNIFLYTKQYRVCIHGKWFWKNLAFLKRKPTWRSLMSKVVQNYNVLTVPIMSHCHINNL